MAVPPNLQVCTEYIDIPPYDGKFSALTSDDLDLLSFSIEVFDIETNTTLRADFDTTFDVELFCQVSDSVDVIHS